MIYQLPLERMKKTYLFRNGWVPAVLLAAIFLTSCSSMHEKIIMANADLALSPNELRACELSALGGNGDAALRIYFHYAFYLCDDERGTAWLRDAAVLGNQDAQEILKLAIDNAAKLPENPTPYKKSVPNPFGD